MQAQQLIRNARTNGRKALDEADGKRLLAEFDIPVPRFVVVAGPDEVERAIAGMPGPFAVKVLSPDILHKSDVGGVVLNAVGADGVRAAVMAIAGQPKVRAARVDGYLVEPMCAPGLEIVVGGSARSPVRADADGRAWRHLRRNIARRGLSPVPDHPPRRARDAGGTARRAAARWGSWPHARGPRGDRGAAAEHRRRARIAEQPRRRDRRARSEPRDHGRARGRGRGCAFRARPKRSSRRARGSRRDRTTRSPWSTGSGRCSCRAPLPCWAPRRRR